MFLVCSESDHMVTISLNNVYTTCSDEHVKHNPRKALLHSTSITMVFAPELSQGLLTAEGQAFAIKRVQACCNIQS